MIGKLGVGKLVKCLPIYQSTMREFFTQRIKRGLVRRLNNFKIATMAREVARKELRPNGALVVFFKASTGIDDLSWSSGFHLLASWAFRLRGIPVVYFACNAGMSHCVLGTNRDDVQKEPPCKSCVYQSRTLYTGANPYWFTFEREQELEKALENLGVEELSKFQWKLNNNDVVARSREAAAKQSPTREEIASPQSALLAMTLPLGALCLPGLRW
ncbi:MAG: hypothetical protein MUO77_09275, partial [Anaerolineales bacterium]|nr:hypothetical protein [Anaerolineales bacterium]